MNIHEQTVYRNLKLLVSRERNRHHNSRLIQGAGIKQASGSK